METAVETLEDNKVKIRVEVDAHDVDHAFEHALNDLRKDMRLPGFRPGKAPIAVIRQRIGEEAVADEALRKFGGESLTEFVRNHDTYREQVRSQTARFDATPTTDPELIPLNWDASLAFGDEDTPTS